MKLPQGLIELAEVFQQNNSTLFVVGGTVRNILLGFPTYDIDIASSLNCEQVEKICKNYKFECTLINPNLGSMCILIDDVKCEYTTFRKEKYTSNGEHIPHTVEFVDVPEQDYVRRDFTANALYLDVLTGKVLDYAGGHNHIAKRRLATVLKPKDTLNSDGLRILRMVRFCVELNFTPCKKTFAQAKRFSYKVAALSTQRIANEVMLSIAADVKYSNKHSHNKVIEYYNGLNMWQYIFDETFKNLKVKTKGQLFNAYLQSDSATRFYAFINLVLFSYIDGKTTDSNILYTIQTLFGPDGMRLSNINIDKIIECAVLAHKIIYKIDLMDKMFLVDFSNSAEYLKSYIELIDIDTFKLLTDQIAEMKKSKVPFSMAELKIDSTKLIEVVGIEPRKTSKVRKQLYLLCVNGYVKNTLTELKKAAKKIDVTAN